jgi:hypothetical protein
VFVKLFAVNVNPLFPINARYAFGIFLLERALRQAAGQTG